MGKENIYTQKRSCNFGRGKSQSITKKSYDKDTIVASVQSLSHVQIFETHGVQHAGFPVLLLSPGV